MNKITKVFLLVLALGLVLWWSISFAVSIRNFRVIISADQELVGRYYLPKKTPPPYATVVLCHGISSQKETMEPLAIELAKHGMAAVTFDFGGQGVSYSRSISQPDNQADLKYIMDWVKSQPIFDATSLGVAGHSMGGTTALDYGLNHSDVQATVLLGIGGQATPTNPQNFMIGIGVYEQLNPVPITQDLFASAISENENLNFTQGIARNLFISTTSEHANAPYDPELIAQTVQWFQRAFGLLEFQAQIQIQWQLVGLALVYLAGIGLGSLLYQGLARRINTKILLVVLLGMIGIGQWQGQFSGYSILFLLPVVLLGQYLARYPASHLIKIPLYLGTLYLMYGLSLLVHGLVSGSLIQVPVGIFSFPVLLVYLPFGITHNLFYLWLHLLQTSHLQAWVWVFLGVIAVLEFNRPGGILFAVDWLIQKGIGLVRQPLQMQWQRPRTTTLIILPLGLGVLIAVLGQQWRSGLFTGEAISFAVNILGVFVLLPIGLTLLVLRSAWMINLETWLQASAPLSPSN